MKIGRWVLVAMVVSGVGGCALPSQEASPLVAASNMLHPPFSSWNDEEEAVGLEVDIVEEAARSLGRRVQWVEMPFKDLLTAIEDGKIDVAVSTIGITEERLRRVQFSRPYFQTEIAAFVGSQHSPPDSLSFFDESRVGADRATTSYDAALEVWPQATFVTQVEEGMTWPAMLDQGLIDVFVVDASDELRLEAQSGLPLERVPSALKAEHFGVALSQEEEVLKKALDEAITKIVDRSQGEANAP